MRSGELRYYASIETATVTQDATGGEVDTWASWKTNVPCKVSALSGSEFWAAQQLQAQDVFIFTFRYVDIAGILPSYRILFNSTYYDIISISEIQPQVGYRIRAQAKVI